MTGSYNPKGVFPFYSETRNADKTSVSAFSKKNCFSFFGFKDSDETLATQTLQHQSSFNFWFLGPGSFSCCKLKEV